MKVDIKSNLTIENRIAVHVGGRVRGVGGLSAFRRVRRRCRRITPPRAPRAAIQRRIRPAMPLAPLLCYSNLENSFYQVEGIHPKPEFCSAFNTSRFLTLHQNSYRNTISV